MLNSRQREAFTGSLIRLVAFSYNRGFLAAAFMDYWIFHLVECRCLRLTRVLTTA
jgi:hypothetical protein